MDAKAVYAIRRLLHSAKILLFGFSVGSLMFLVSIEVFHMPALFSKDVRSVIVLAAALPVFLFLFGLYLYEHDTGPTGLSWQQISLGAAMCLLLLLPSTYLVYRFQIPESSRKWIVTAIALPWLIQIGGPLIVDTFEVGRSSTVTRMIGFLRRVMTTEDNGTDSSSSPLFTASFREQRAPLYVDKEALAVFQSSLSCQTRDALECAAWFKASPARDEVKMLDIGGGDGEFTYRFVSHLLEKQVAVTELTAVEPGDWNNEYRAFLSEFLDSIDFQHVGFQNYQGTGEPFDIVLASHSLYGVLDLHLTTEQDRQNLITKLLGFVRPGGYAFILLAAPQAQSYYFKSEALNILFGNYPPDASSATIRTLLIERGFKDRIIDNVMDLDEPLAEYRSGSPGRLLQWLSYFLRVDFGAMAETDVATIVARLQNYVVRCESLTESFAAELQAIADRSIRSKSEVLPHKTALYVRRKTSDWIG